MVSYSGLDFTYTSKLVVCVSRTYSKQAGEREQCCRMAILLHLSVWKWIKFQRFSLHYLWNYTVERFDVFFKNLYFQAAQIPNFYIVIMDEKVLVLCEKLLSKFSSNLYVLRPPESEKMVFTKVSVCLPVV